MNNVIKVNYREKVFYRDKSLEKAEKIKNRT